MGNASMISNVPVIGGVPLFGNVSVISVSVIGNVPGNAEK